MRLDGKTAMVTGAGRGLGRAFALRLAKLGADLVLIDIDPAAHEKVDEARSTAGEVEALGRRVLDIRGDVTRRGDVEGAVAQALTAFGAVDVLVNNVGGMLGITQQGSAASVTADQDIQAAFANNLMSTIYGCQAVVPHMIDRGQGVIVNISTRAGANVHPRGEFAAMAAAKAGVNHYTRYLAVELGPKGVRVNALAPGPIAMGRAVAQDTGAIPLRRYGTPEECADALAFLATDQSSFVTGQVLSVCGGLMCHPS